MRLLWARTLECNAYPAIEALALAVTAIRQEADRDTGADDDDELPLADSYVVRELL